MLDDQPVGLVEASVVLELPVQEARGTLERLPVVIASDRSHHFGVIVDRFLGERDLRVSPLDPRLGKVPNINSSSVLENGWPVLIIDVEDLIRSIDNMLSGRRLGKLAAGAVEKKVASSQTGSGRRRFDHSSRARTAIAGKPWLCGRRGGRRGRRLECSAQRSL